MRSAHVGKQLNRFVRRARRSFEYRTGRVVAWVMCEIKELETRHSERLSQQLQKYELLGLDRDAGITAYLEAVKEAGVEASVEIGDSRSEHKVLLGALAAKRLPISKILEIGTLEGSTTKVLTYLFPEAIVTTMDLPASDSAYHASYEYSRSREFVEKRKLNVRSSSRIKFVEQNSLSLSLESVDSNYDLVWVDGDHDFPTVGIDLANSVRLLRPGGYLMCDDVISERISRTSTYNSNAAHRTLVALHGAGLIESPVYLYKRLGKHNQHPRKFVAITRTRARNQAS
ncbi:MAG: class I SAM-dependent methyltransferase [Actinomycetota bacterium]